MTGMLRAGAGQAEHPDASTSVRLAIAQARAFLDSRAPQAALIFAGAEIDHEKMLATFADELPDTLVMGCTTAGELSSEAGFSELSTCVMLFQSDDIRFAAGLATGASDNPVRATRQAVAAARTQLDSPEVICIVLPDGTSRSIQQVVETLDEVLNCPIVGGASGRHGLLANTTGPRQFFGREIVNDAVPVMLAAGPMKVAFSVGTSWRPVGPESTVEDGEGNDVRRIGGMSALSYYRHYLGHHSRPASEFPLAIQAGDGSGFTIRVPVAYDEQVGSIRFGAPVPVGSRVRLAEVDRGGLVAGVSEAAVAAQRAWGDGQPAAALVFSCNARKGILGSRAPEELNLLKSGLPAGLPIAGFYGFAEIAPLLPGGRCRLHHTTLVTVLLGPGSLRQTPEQTVTAPAVRDVETLAKALARSEYYRRDLEDRQEANAALLRTLYSEIAAEKARSEELLLHLLPRSVADRLKGGEERIADAYEAVTVLFADLVGFTPLSARLPPETVVGLLNAVFSDFDALAIQLGAEKIRTIGDGYMVAAGVPNPRPDHAKVIADLALGMLDVAAAHSSRDQPVALRIGINTGPVIAGVIGKHKFQYDLWADAVNTAARMESHGVAGKIQVGPATARLLESTHVLEKRGAIEVKGKGPMETWWLVGKR